MGPPTLDALCERITAEPYTLLHVVCHGQFRRETGETVLYWDTADQRVDPVAGTRLLERLGRLQGARGLPHFAFLATCESARAEAEGALGGLAQRLVRELGMPAVVAMTETVSVTTPRRWGRPSMDGCGNTERWTGPWSRPCRARRALRHHGAGPVQSLVVAPFSATP